MKEILIFLHRLEKNLDNFWDFSKGNMPLRIGKYYLFSLLLLSASAYSVELLSLTTGEQYLTISFLSNQGQAIVLDAGFVSLRNHN